MSLKQTVQLARPETPAEFVSQRSFAGLANGRTHQTGTPMLWETQTWHGPRQVRFGMSAEGGTVEVYPGSVVIARKNGVISLRTFDRVPGLLRKLAVTDFLISGPNTHFQVREVARSVFTRTDSLPVAGADMVKFIPDISAVQGGPEEVQTYDAVSTHFDRRLHNEFSLAFDALQAIRNRRA